MSECLMKVERACVVLQHTNTTVLDYKKTNKQTDNINGT